MQSVQEHRAWDFHGLGLKSHLCQLISCVIGPRDLSFVNVSEPNVQAALMGSAYFPHDIVEVGGNFRCFNCSHVSRACHEWAKTR